MDREELNEHTVRKAYRFLAHGNWTEVRAIDTHGKGVAREFLNSEEKVVRFAKKWNGKRNVYIGINARKEKGEGSAKGIGSVKTIVIDIDVVRPDNKQPATRDELKQAEKVANQMIKDFKEGKGYERPVKNMSGNGYQLWIAIPGIKLRSESGRTILAAKLRKFYEYLSTKYSTDKIKVDNIGDLPRIIKLIGTKSVKGEHTKKRPHRVSYSCAKFERREDESFKKDLLAGVFDLAKQPTPLKVSELSADFIGKQVKVEVQITGEKLQKALPRKIDVECVKCNAWEEIDLLEEGESAIEVLLAVIFKNKNVLRKLAEHRLEKSNNLYCDKGEHKIWYKETGYMDFAILYARDLPNKVERFDERTYQSRCIYLVGERPPRSKKVSIEGRAVVEQKSRDISILASKIKPLENVVENFKVSGKDKELWKKYFSSSNSIANEINPDIIQRDLGKEVVISLLHSPPIIPDVNDERIRGCLRIIFYGDTKTGKSKIAQDLTGEIESGFAFGEYVMGETSSRAGITYTIDTDKKAIIWGALPLNDLGLVVIDGLHQMFSEEMKELREALEKQKVKVCRSQSGEALARTRIIGCLNPNKPMAEYIYPAMGITDNYVFSSHPEITRWDLFVPFAHGDVPPSEIARRKKSQRPIPKEAFTRHVLWAWSRKPEQIRYLHDAKEQIVASSEQIMEKYSMEALPLVHNGFRDVLTRLAVAVAAMHHSTNKRHELIIVKKQYVDYAARLYKSILDLLQLREYKLEDEGKTEILPTQFEEIVTELGEMEYDILDKIKVKPSTSTVLAEEFDVSTDTIKRHYTLLRRHGLIKTSPHKGIALTARGVRFLTMLSQDENLGSKNIASSSEKDSLVAKNATIPLNSASTELKNEEGRSLKLTNLRKYSLQHFCPYCGDAKKLTYLDRDHSPLCSSCKRLLEKQGKPVKKMLHLIGPEGQREVGKEFISWMVTYFRTHRGIPKTFFVNDTIKKFPRANPREVEEFYNLLIEYRKEGVL